MEQRKKVLVLLVIGLIATSFPAIFVRLADANALTISFYRNFLASLFILPLALFHFKKLGDYSALSPRIILASLFLAFHFYCWNASLKLTTVASSLVIVATQPIWSALLGVVFLKEKISLRGFLSVFIAVSGVCAIAFLDIGKGSENLLGDLLALIAAVLASSYLITGRSVKDKIPLPLWLFSLYFLSSLILLFVCLISGVKLHNFSQTTYLMFFLMALIPSFIGHSLLNYAVRFIEAYKVQLWLLLEPIVSTFLAFLIFSEKPNLLFYPAAFVSLLGVILGISENYGKKAQP
ncbi:MAG: DMT family transporter [Thermoanaerobaculaceae bacterium]|nr:DMT family transporter [Thermoanaerobaculaceae bacterium]